MSLMTREDVLRELELLPVWQLKAPLSSVSAMPALTPVQTNVIESAALLSQIIEPVIEPVIEPAPLDSVHVEIAAVAAPFRLLISDNASMAFALDSSSSDAQDVETLLSNMLKAININCSIDIAEATITTLAEHRVKLLVVMGEMAAHGLMGQLQTIEDWRSDQSANPLNYQNLPVVITYHPAFLLKNTDHKAKAWVDLCAAKRILQGL